MHPVKKKDTLKYLFVSLLSLPYTGDLAHVSPVPSEQVRCNQGFRQLSPVLCCALLLFFR